MNATAMIRFVSCWCWFAAGAAALAFPVQVPYSGQLAENGELVNGTKAMKFEIFNAATGGASRYASGAVLVPVSNGAFSVLLGGTNFNVLDSSVFDGTAAWLEVSVAATNNPSFMVLEPRQRIFFTPQSAYAVAAGMANNAAIASSVAAGSINASNLADGAVTLPKLSLVGAQPGQFLNSGSDGSTAQWGFLSLNPGPGLLGGGSNWPMSLQVNFGTNGLATAAARSDHDHQNLTNRGMFTVQYRETDFNFASRLMEEEGIFYYFKINNGDKMVLMGADDVRTSHAGPSVELRAGDGLGTNQAGGNLIFKPGLGTGAGESGSITLASHQTMFQPDGTPLRAQLSVDSLNDPMQKDIVLNAYTIQPDQDGPNLVLGAGDASGLNHNGGAIVLRTGTNSLGKRAPLRLESGIIHLDRSLSAPMELLQVTGWTNPPASLWYTTNGQWQLSSQGGPPLTIATRDVLGNLNSDRIDGVSAEQLARLDRSNNFAASNRFLGPVMFDQPVTHATNLYFKYELENTMVSGFSIGPAADPVPTESISFNFEAVSLTYTQQLTNGASIKLKAADALAPNARGGNLQLTAGQGGAGGATGKIQLDGSSVNMKLARIGQEVVVDFLEGDPDQPVIVAQVYDHADIAPFNGASYKLKAGDAVGGNRNGGHIILQPGYHSGSGVSGKVIASGDLVATGAVSAASFNGSGAGLTGVNAATLAGVAGNDFARLSTSNRFSAPMTFGGEVRFESNSTFTSVALPTANITGGGAGSGLDADKLDGLDWTTHPLLQNLEPPSTSLSVTGAFPGIRLRGSLRHADGFPANGLTGITVRLYSQPTGGTPLYVERFTLAVANGAVDVVIGAGLGSASGDLVGALNPDPGAPFERYLTLQIEPDTEELSPRRRLTAGAYAVYAQNAAQLGGQPASDYVRRDQANTFTAPQTFSNGLSAAGPIALQLPLRAQDFDSQQTLSFRLAGSNNMALEVSSGLAQPRGTSLTLRSGDAAGADQNGGDILLQPGSGGGLPGKVIAAGDLAVTGAVSAASFTGGGAGLTGVNAAALAGVAGNDFARLSTSNRFDAPMSFGGPVRLDNNLYLQYELEDTMVSSFSMGPSTDPVPTESVSFNFEAISMTYTQQFTNGASLKFKAADALAPGARGGDIRLAAGQGGAGGAGGNIRLDASSVNLKLPRIGQEVVVDFLEGDPDQPMLVGRVSNHADTAPYNGPSYKLKAGDAVGGNQNGGNVILEPGNNSGSGAPGKVIVSRDLMVTGGVSAVSFTGNGAGLTGVNAAALSGVPANDLARLSSSNQFNAPQSFNQGVWAREIHASPALATFLPEVEDEVLVMFQNGDANRPVVTSRLSNSPDQVSDHGVSRKIQAGDGVGADKDGGNIILEPGNNSGNGMPGKVVVSRDLMVTGAVSAARFMGDGSELTAVNAASLSGVPANDYARLSASNRFTALQTFEGPVRFEGSTVFLGYKFEDAIISGWSISGTGGDVPTESVSLNFTALDYRSNAPGADVTIAAGHGTGTNLQGGSISLRPGPNSAGNWCTAVVVMDADNTDGPARPVELRVKQGTQPDGVLRYNPATAQWESSNNGGGSYAPLLVAGASGLNADTLDGMDSTAFAQPSVSNTWSASQTFDGGIRLGKLTVNGLSGDDVINIQGPTGGGSIGALSNSLRLSPLPGGSLVLDAPALTLGHDSNSTVFVTGGFAGTEGLSALFRPGRLEVGGSLNVSSNLAVSGSAIIAGTLAANSVVTTNPVAGAVAKPAMTSMNGTPSVANATVLLLNNYFAPMDITNLLNGVEGQVVVLVGGNNPAPPVVRDNNSIIPGAFKLGRNLDWQALPDHTLTLCRMNGQWLETARSEN